MNCNPTKANRAPLRGFFGGAIMGGMIFVFGVVLTFVFFPIGIPVLLAGIALPFFSLNCRSGRCPHCGAKVFTGGSGGKCRACKRRMAVRAGRYVAV